MRWTEKEGRVKGLVSHLHTLAMQQAEIEPRKYGPLEAESTLQPSPCLRWITPISTIFIHECFYACEHELHGFLWDRIKKKKLTKCFKGDPTWYSGAFPFKCADPL